MIELTISTTRTELLPGESLPLVIALENKGSEAVEVPEPDCEMPFELRLVPVGKGRSYELTQRESERALRGYKPVRPAPPSMVPLGANAAFEYRADLATLATQEIAAGTYDLTATACVGSERCESNRVRVTVAAHRVGAFAALASPINGSLTSAYVHQTADGSRALFQRVSQSRNPALGATYRRMDMAEEPDSLAISLDHRECRHSWVAWIAGDELTLTAGWGTSFSEALSFPVALHSARLLDPCRAVSKREATFLVAGQDGDRAVLRSFTSTFKPRLPPPIPGAPPERPPRPIPPPVVVSHDLGEGVLGEIEVVYPQDVSSPSLRVAWSEAAEGLTRIRSRTLPEGQTLDLYERTGPLVAFAAPPLQSGRAWVDAVFGPPGGEGSLTWARLPMDGGDPIAEWTFDPPIVPVTDFPWDVENKAVAGIERWALPAGALARPIALGWGRGRIFALDPGAGSWRVVRRVEELTALRLVVLGRRLWMAWAEPGVGVRYAAMD